MATDISSFSGQTSVKCNSASPNCLRQQATGNRQQATGNRQQATGNRQQATGNRQQATGNYTPNSLNHVNYLAAYIQSNQFKHSHFLAIQAVLYVFCNKPISMEKNMEMKRKISKLLLIAIIIAPVSWIGYMTTAIIDTNIHAEGAYYFYKKNLLLDVY